MLVIHLSRKKNKYYKNYNLFICLLLFASRQGKEIIINRIGGEVMVEVGDKGRNKERRKDDKI